MLSQIRTILATTRTLHSRVVYHLQVGGGATSCMQMSWHMHELKVHVKRLKIACVSYLEENTRPCAGRINSTISVHDGFAASCNHNTNPLLLCTKPTVRR